MYGIALELNNPKMGLNVKLWWAIKKLTSFKSRNLATLGETLQSSIIQRDRLCIAPRRYCIFSGEGPAPVGALRARRWRAAGSGTPAAAAAAGPARPARCSRALVGLRFLCCVADDKDFLRFSQMVQNFSHWSIPYPRLTLPNLILTNLT